MPNQVLPDPRTGWLSTTLAGDTTPFFFKKRSDAIRHRSQRLLQAGWPKTRAN
jgi:hypothetical protein